MESTPRGVSWLGFFYGGNLAGAVTGCLFAGFYLLRVHDLATATFTGMALNLAVAGIALRVARGTVGGTGNVEEASAPVPRTTTLYAVVAISGLCALGSEVIWTRLLSLLLLLLAGLKIAQAAAVSARRMTVCKADAVVAHRSLPWSFGNLHRQ